MKTHLVYYNWQLNSSFFGIVIGHIEEILNESNDNVIFLTCDSILNNCLHNKLKSQIVCCECRFVNKVGLNTFIGNARVEHIQIGQLIRIDDYSNYPLESYLTVKDLKAIRYRSVNIGYGALSSYVSYTRNQSPDFENSQTKKYFNDLLLSQIYLTDAVYLLLSTKKIDFFHVYNGRWADVRPIYDIAKEMRIEVNVLEALNDNGTFFYKEVYKNALPQNINYRTQWIRSLWESSKLTYNEKYKLGSSFYDKRRNSEDTGDVHVYTMNQKTGLLPENWDSSRRNFVIFNSSEDEFVALGNDYDAYSLFRDQEQGIEYLLNQVIENTDIHFYLRIHPNLAEVPFGYHKRLFDLERKYKNISVIRGDAPISTYTLIDQAEKIIVFTSTVGVEACYWGKPAIVLSAAGYYYLDVAYVPKSISEIKSLLIMNLVAKNNLGAVKYGYFLLSKRERTTDVLRNPIEVRFLGMSLGHRFSHLKLFNSSLIFRLILHFWTYFIKGIFLLFSKSNFKSIPVKERLHL